MTVSTYRRFLAASLVTVGLLVSAYRGRSQERNTVSPREQLKEYVAQLQNNPNDQELREMIIKLALTLHPPPAVPDEVHELLGEARAALNAAKTKEDYASAVAAFQKALLLAPWNADLNYDLGKAQEMAGQYDDAIESYNLYLLAAPDAKDRDSVLEHIGEIRYNARTAVQEEESFEKLKGLWAAGPGKRGIGSFCDGPPGLGNLYSIDIRGHQIEVTLLQGSYHNCKHAFRFPHSYLNLPIFEGTLAEGRITGVANCYDVRPGRGKVPFAYLSASDFYIVKTQKFELRFAWRGNGNSFTMSPWLRDGVGLECSTDDAVVFYRPGVLASLGIAER